MTEWMDFELAFPEAEPKTRVWGGGEWRKHQLGRGRQGKECTGANIGVLLCLCGHLGLGPAGKLRDMPGSHTARQTKKLGRRCSRPGHPLEEGWSRAHAQGTCTGHMHRQNVPWRSLGPAGRQPAACTETGGDEGPRWSQDSAPSSSSPNGCSFT